MDMHIILNPATGANSPPNPQSSLKIPRRGTPTSVPTSVSTTCRRSGRGLRSSASTGTLTPVPTHNSNSNKVHATAYRRRASSLNLRQGTESPLSRQVASKKRLVERGDEDDTPRKHHKHKQTNESRRGLKKNGGRDRERERVCGSARRHSSSVSTTSATSSTRAASPGSASARALLSRARQHVAEEEGALGGRRTRSFMDVVMDLKGPGSDGTPTDYVEDVQMIVEECATTGVRREYNFTIHDGAGLAAYWADQAALWTGVSADGGGYFGDVLLARFPISMERSTAGWDCLSP